MADRDTTANPADRANATYGNMRPDAPHASTPTPSTDAKPAQIDLRQQAKDDLKAVQDLAKEHMHRTRDSAEDIAERQKGFAAQQVAGVASAMERVGADLEGGENREVGRMARQLGETMHRFANDIEGRSMGDIAGMAEDFGRRQPLAFLGLAAIAGLAASRFVSASASRQSAGPVTPRPSSTTAASASSGYAPTANPTAANATNGTTSGTAGGSNV